MKCSGWSSLAISVCSALVLVGGASAHVVASPQFLASGDTESISLAAPNERDEPMTGFAVTAPPGLEIVHAHPSEGWSEQLDGSTATWTGGSLPTLTETSFGISLKAVAQPGIVVLETQQRYDGGEVVRWPVAITVIPGTEGSSQNLALAAVVGLVGVLVVVAVAMVAWRRRADAAQEN